MFNFKDAVSFSILGDTIICHGTSKNQEFISCLCTFLLCQFAIALDNQKATLKSRRLEKCLQFFVCFEVWHLSSVKGFV